MESEIYQEKQRIYYEKMQAIRRNEEDQAWQIVIETPEED